MPMVSMSRVLKESGGSNGGLRIKGVTVTVKESKNKVKQTSYVIFMVSKEVAEELRWIDGDHVDVLWDKDTLEGQIVRCKDSRWTVMKGKSPGASYRIAFTVPSEAGFPVGRSLREHITTNNTIIFRY